jgi:hypothetical protein
MVLEFEITDDRTRNVQITYTDERPHVNAGRIDDVDHVRPEVERIIRQKSKGWSYEEEYRLYVNLPDCDARGGHYYQALEPGVLKKVIVGWRSTTDVNYVQRALSLAGFSGVPVVRAAIQSKTYKLKC